MADTQVMSVLRLWAAVAWADGTLAEAEASSMRRLIGSADLTTDERTQAIALLAKRVVIPDQSLEHLTPDARRGVYRAACRLAVVDHKLSPYERATLVKMRGVLGVPADIAGEIEADVPGFGR